MSWRGDISPVKGTIAGKPLTRMEIHLKLLMLTYRQRRQDGWIYKSVRQHCAGCMNIQRLASQRGKLWGCVSKA